MNDIAYTEFEGSLDDALELVITLSASLFADFDPAYVRSRRPMLANARLWLATVDGAPAGFKFGYEREPGLFYSWLGGVLPTARKMGIASGLMVKQHADLAAAGIAYVETRTRAANNAMIILNLKSGFEIKGVESDTRGWQIVWQRKRLEVAS